MSTQAQEEEYNIYWYVNDHLDTPQKLVDESGNIVNETYLTPFGEVALESETVRNNFRFPGQYHDRESMLYYNWNRYYMPSVGRYNRVDPFDFATDLKFIRTIYNFVEQCSFSILPIKHSFNVPSFIQKENLFLFTSFPFLYSYNNPLSLADSVGLHACYPNYICGEDCFFNPPIRLTYKEPGYEGIWICLFRISYGCLSRSIINAFEVGPCDKPYTVMGSRKWLYYELCKDCCCCN